MGHTNAWDETTPTGSENANTADDYLRKHRLDLGERLEAILYGFNASDNSTPEDTAGIKNLPCYKQSSDPIAVTNYGHAYTKKVGAVVELFYQGDDGKEVQLTTGGIIKLTSAALLGILANNTYFTAVNNAGTGSVNLIKAGPNDLPTLSDGALIAAKTESGDSPRTIADKAYVDNLLAHGISGGNESTGETTIGPLQIKWGKESVAADSSETIDFTDKGLSDFDNACLHAQISYASGSSSHENPCTISSLTTTQLTVHNGDDETKNLFWFAIGR